ncbi:MAG: hypothetical protein FD153_1407, partial [Rhodospirillaceae bacterium]
MTGARTLAKAGCISRSKGNDRE